MSDNMTINRLRFGFHRSDNRFSKFRTSFSPTLDNLSRSNQNHMTFKRLHLLNGASSYQILHETHIVNHVWSFRLPHYI